MAQREVVMAPLGGSSHGKGMVLSVVALDADAKFKCQIPYSQTAGRMR